MYKEGKRKLAETSFDKIKQSEGKWYYYTQGENNLNTTDFSLETTEARNSGRMSLKCQRGKLSTQNYMFTKYILEEEKQRHFYMTRN